MTGVENKKIKSPCFGDEAVSKKGVLTLKYPIEWGIVTNWEEIELFYDNVFKEKLGIGDTDGKIVLCTERSLNPKANREKLTQIMFEQFNAGGFYLANCAAMTLIESGRTSGYVLESGDGCTMPVPIYEGCILRHAVMKVLSCGNDLRYYLVRSLDNLNDLNSVSLLQSNRGVITDIKRLCYVSMDYINDIEHLKMSPAQYQLPDGNTILVAEERCMCPEIYFDPFINGEEMQGIHETIHHSIQRCDIDIRGLMYQNIVLGGGSALFPGFPERLESELRKISGYKGQIKVTPSTGILSAWRGACMLAESSTFPSMILTKDNYDEYGPSLVHRMCF